MSTPIILTNFAAGELSPQLHGRTDLKQYHAGVKVARNVFVDYRGGLSTRPGTARVGVAKSQLGKPRLIPFNFNNEQTYELAFDAQKGMQIIANGGMITEAALPITAVTNANPGRVTATGSGFADDDVVVIDGVVGMVRANGVSGLNGRTFRVRSAAGDQFFLTNEFRDFVDTSSYTAYTSGGTVRRVYTVGSPWDVEDLYDLKYTQSADVMTVTHPDYAPFEIRRFGNTDWRITPVAIGSRMAQPPNQRAIATEGSSSGQRYMHIYIVTARDPVSKEESTTLGQVLCENFALDPSKGTVNTIYWDPVASPSGLPPEYIVYKSQVYPVGTEGPPPYFFGLMARATSSQVVDLNNSSDFNTVPPTNENPFSRGGLTAAAIIEPGFGYIAPSAVIHDGSGTGAAVTLAPNAAGAITLAEIAQAGDNYAAPTVEVVDLQPTLGSGLVMHFDGTMVAALPSGFKSAPGSVHIDTPSTGYHVPYWQIVPVAPGSGSMSVTDRTANVTYTVGDTVIDVSANAGAGEAARGTVSYDKGKWVFGFELNSGGAAAPTLVCGLATVAAGLASSAALGAGGVIGFNAATIYQPGNDAVIMTNTAAGMVIRCNGTAVANSAVGYGASDTIVIAVDLTSQLVWFKNENAIGVGGQWNLNLNGNPAAGTGGIDISGLTSERLYPYFGAVNGITGASLGVYDATAAAVAAFTTPVPAGFTAGWGLTNPQIGTAGFGYVGTIGSVPTTVVTLADVWVPQLDGYNFDFTYGDTLPGFVLGSQALVTVTLSTLTNPGVVALFAQRRWFAASNAKPDSFWASRPGAFSNFNTSFPTQPDDAITGTIAVEEVNAISSMVAMPSGLIMLTSGGAYQVSGGTPGAAITPTDITAQAQAFNGAASIQPLRVVNDILYLTHAGFQVRDMAYNFYLNVYTGVDVSKSAQHLFEGRAVVDWCYAEAPFFQVPIVRDDGILVSFTYLKESELYGWTRWDTAGLFIDVSTISEEQANNRSEDVLYFVVRRYIDGRFIYTYERLASRFFGGNAAVNVPSNPEEAWCVDCGSRTDLAGHDAELIGRPNGAQKTLGALRVIAGGSGYTLPVVEIIDPTGSGAAILLTLAAGVITGGSVTPGEGYTNPQFTIRDATGSGGVITCGIENQWLWRTNVSVFSIGDIGRVLRAAGGIGTVLAAAADALVTDQTTTPAAVMVNVPGETVTYPVPTGSWSLATPVSVVGGLDIFNGSTVAVVADGNVLDTQEVVDGCITLDTPASLVLAGAPFTWQIQTLRIDAGDITMQGRRKEIPAVTLRSMDTRGVWAGPDFGSGLVELSTLVEDYGQNTIVFQEGGGVAPALVEGGAASQFPLNYADRRKNIPSEWNVDGYVCLQGSYPMPATILALIPEIDVSDDPS